jgi:hypothetical protein
LTGATTTASLITTSTTYVALAGGPAVTTTPVTGRAIVTVTAAIDGENFNNSCFMSFVLSGGNTLAAADNRSLMISDSEMVRVSATYVLSGLNNSSTTFTAQYRSSTGGNDCAFSDRNLTVIPF